MKVLCTICARKGSKGVPNKNVKEILGKPLIAFSIEQALESNLFDKIVVSTDSEEIKKIAKNMERNVGFLDQQNFAKMILQKYQQYNMLFGNRKRNLIANLIR